MSIRERLLLFTIVIVFIVLGTAILKTEPERPSFVEEPFQKVLDDVQSVQIYTKEGVINLDLIAEYKAWGVIKGRKNYSSDNAAKVSPMDIVLAWGTLNRSEIDEKIRYTQSSRCYFYKYKEDIVVEQINIGRMSSNIHIIPADESVLKALKKSGVGDYMELTGYLVNVDFGDGGPLWVSSITREDTGDGACEIMYVTGVREVDAEH